MNANRMNTKPLSLVMRIDTYFLAMLKLCSID